MFNVCPSSLGVPTIVALSDLNALTAQMASHLAVTTAETAQAVQGTYAFTLTDLLNATRVAEAEIGSLPSQVSVDDATIPTVCTPRRVTIGPVTAHGIATWRAHLTRATAKGAGADVGAVFPFSQSAPATTTISAPVVAGQLVYGLNDPNVSPRAGGYSLSNRAGDGGAWLVGHQMLRTLSRVAASTLPWKGDLGLQASKIIQDSQAYGSSWSESWTEPGQFSQGGGVGGAGGTPAGGIFHYGLFTRDANVVLPDNLIVGLGLQGFECAAGSTPFPSVCSSFLGVVASQPWPTKVESFALSGIAAQKQHYIVILSTEKMGRARHPYGASDTTAPRLAYIVGEFNDPNCESSTCPKKRTLLDVVELSAFGVHPLEVASSAPQGPQVAAPIAARLSHLIERDLEAPGRSHYNSLGMAHDKVPSLHNPYDADNSPISAFQTYLDAAQGSAKIADDAWSVAASFEAGKNPAGGTTSEDKLAKACGSKGCPNTANFLVSSSVAQEQLFPPVAKFGASVSQCDSVLNEAGATPDTVVADVTKLKLFFACTSAALAGVVGQVPLPSWPQPLSDDLKGDALHANVNAATSGELRTVLLRMEDAACKLRTRGELLLLLNEQAQQLATAYHAVAIRSCLPAPEPSKGNLIGLVASLAKNTAAYVGIWKAVSPMLGLSSVSIGWGAGAVAGYLVYDYFEDDLADFFAGPKFTTPAPECLGELEKVTRFVSLYGAFKKDLVGIRAGIREALIELGEANGELDALIGNISFANAGTQVVGVPPAWKTSLTPITDEAHDALRRGQTASFVARRSVEARLALSLASDTKPSGVLPAPALWTNNMFGGRASAGGTESPRVYTPSYLPILNETIKQYLFAYGLTNPYSSGEEERLVSLRSRLLPGTSPDDIPLVEALSVVCADGTLVGPSLGACAPDVFGSMVDSRCSGALQKGVKSYQAAFTLDGLASNAWGGASTQLANGPALAGFDQYNFRVLGFAINVPGNSVAAQGDGVGSLPYRLLQLGDSVVSDHNLTPVLLRLPSAVIASGLGRTAPEGLKLPLINEQLDTMQPYLRKELLGRPPGGMYHLELPATTGNLCHAEDVELYMKLLFWVRNQ